MKTIAMLRQLLHDRLLALPWPYTTPQALDAFDDAAAAAPTIPAPNAPRVTDEELAEVARLDAAATPGPWAELPALWPLAPDHFSAADGAQMLLAPLLPRLAAEVTALRAEVAERDAQIARLAVDSAAVEAKLTIEAMAANQRAADRADALAGAGARLETIGDVARDILLAAEDSAVPEHSDVPTKMIDALRKALK